MKKKTWAGALSLPLSLVMLLTACGSQNAEPSEPAGSASNPPESSAVSSAPSDAPSEPVVFTPGTWLSDGGQYYFFDEDGATGRTASLDNGTGVGFSYVTDGAKADFAMGGADNSSPCTVRRDGDTITLEWESGSTEHLTYVSEQGSDSFQFYSNQELADMALAYYKEGLGAQAQGNLSAAAQTNSDGSVTIQVYENLGDHNSTAVWYTVDRLTGAGTDASGGEVELAG